MKILKNILLVLSPFLIISCSGSGTTISLSEKVDLSEYEKVYWGISNSDSLFDFRKTNNGFAILTDSLIVQTINKDSVNVYKLSNFKTIYADDGLNFLRYSITALLAILTIYGIYFVPKGVD